MKLVIIGGHLAPALAVIEALPKETELLFIGRKYTFEGDKALSLEYQKITSLGIPFRSIKTARLQRRFTLHTLPSLGKLPYGMVQAYKILAEFRPNAIVCFGGYVQIPVVLAASMLKIPVILHEQTLKAGMANRLISNLATKICISWEESRKFFPKGKTVLTGNPLRKEFFEKIQSTRKKDEKDHLPHLFVTGGSAGSHAINTLIEGCLEKLLQNFFVIHQTGDAKQFTDFDRLQKLKRELPQKLQQRYNLVKFVDPQEIAQTLFNADIIIARSGMNTTTELLYLGKPCLLIPLPYGQTNEQLDNALLLERVGLGTVAKQNELTSEKLYSHIAEILAKLDTYEIYSQKAKTLIHADAAEKIVEIIKNTRR
jgi:UDP-N-acetylglucosamine--N-acetylmuramyl-(pentapeptide) pyrophosphoryl-undecaprenol N-acetylglucosamine transferase